MVHCIFFVTFAPESARADPTQVAGLAFDGGGGPWTKSGSPYIVIGSVSIPLGKTLTIEPGVEVKFDEDNRIFVGGVLIAKGRESDRIIFTSNSADPQPGDWSRIFVNATGVAEINYCDISYSEYGIFLSDSSNNEIIGNNISHNSILGIGIYGDGAYSNHVSENRIFNNDKGIHVYNPSTPITRSSSAHILSHNFIFNNSVGILLSVVDKGEIKGVNISSSRIYENDIGIELNSNAEGITNITISNCTIEENRLGVSGLGLGSSFYKVRNYIFYNNITNNTQFGISFTGSQNNLIHHNNFIGNGISAQVNDDSGLNFWNDTYPSGGNFWSGYTGFDNMSGQAQNQSDSDGFGDTPYIIDNSSQDNYPRMVPVNIVVVPPDHPPDSNNGSSNWLQIIIVVVIIVILFCLIAAVITWKRRK